MLSYCRHQHQHPNPADPALEVVNLSVNYRGEQRLAVNSLNIKVPKGQVIALVGPNGAGKSTFFKVLSGLLSFNHGDVRIFGLPLGQCHHRVVYLPQRSDIDWQFPINVMDFVLTGRFVYLGWLKGPSIEDRNRAQKYLVQLKIDDLAKKQISQLSGGQQQRVLIARALTQDADLLLLDEPLNAIDRQTREVVGETLKQMKKEGKTIVVATHYYDQEEGLYDGAIYLRDGVQLESPQDDGKHDECC